MILLYILVIISIIYNQYRAFENAEMVICKKPNDFWNIIAPPGIGKTTLAAKLVHDARNEGKKAYSNVPIRGAIQIDIKRDLGRLKLHDCIIIIDEAGSDLSNRSWFSNLTLKCIEFIKKHRHYNIDIYCFSQAYGDMDNKFRDLVTRVYLLNTSKIPFCVYAQSLKKVMKLEGGQIVEYLEECSSESFRFLKPFYWAYFNSWSQDMHLLDNGDELYYTILDLM